MKDNQKELYGTKEVTKIKRSTQTDIKIVKTDVYTYSFRRSFVDGLLFGVVPRYNVVGLDHNGEILCVVQADVTFDEAVEQTEALNAELDSTKN